MELIDRQAAIDAVHSAVFDFFDFAEDDSESPMTYHDEQLLSINKAITTKIKSLPSVNRKKGRWILDEHPHDGDCRCSACGIAIDAMHERNHGCLNVLTGGKWWTFYKFCPQCGADMRGEENENQNN